MAQISNLKSKTLKKIAIFASGSGSNAEKIMEYFKENAEIKVKIVLANKAKAGVLERAKKYDIPTLVFGRKEFYETTEILEKLEELEIVKKMY